MSAVAVIPVTEVAGLRLLDIILAISAFVILPAPTVGDIASDVDDVRTPLAVVTPGVAVGESEEATTDTMPVVTMFESTVDISCDVVDTDEMSELTVTGLEVVLSNALSSTDEKSVLTDTGFMVVGDRAELTAEEILAFAVSALTFILGDTAEFITEETLGVIEIGLEVVAF